MSPDKIDIIVLTITKPNDGQNNLEVFVLTLQGWGPAKWGKIICTRVFFKCALDIMK